MCYRPLRGGKRSMVPVAGKANEHLAGSPTLATASVEKVFLKS